MHFPTPWGYQVQSDAQAGKSHLFGFSTFVHFLGMICPLVLAITEKVQDKTKNTLEEKVIIDLFFHNAKDKKCISVSLIIIWTIYVWLTNKKLYMF